MTRSNAERQRAYRERKRASGLKAARGKGGVAHRDKSKWKHGYFVALDGEGQSVGEMQRFEMASGKVYECKKHEYTLLAASSGESLYNGGKALKTKDCIDFLLDLSRDHPQAIFVIFAGAYDINHMLMFGFHRIILQDIARGETVEFEMEGVQYAIEYRARKSLTLRRGLEWHEDKDGKSKPRWKDRVTLWDVFGFFQENFVAVMRKWLGKEWRHFDLIQRMKAKRGDFANIVQSEINNYNAAELESLTAIMEKVRAGVTGLGLELRRWDGAGSIAAALMKKHEIKAYKAVTPAFIIDAVRRAYAGGRIEVCKIGHCDHPVYDYDINSAYPSVMADLPCLAHGSWEKGAGDPPAGFTLVHVRYDFADDLSFYPLFYRTDKMQISFPARGEGWYWWPEYEAALACPGTIEVMEWLHFKPYCDHRPFGWIFDYYKTRQEWIKQPEEDWQHGGEKIIKLGLNSLYGKSAQQLGGKKDSPPAYHQLEWAGYITSSTRARLYTAASLLPDAVIGFATDGIFTIAPLPIECSDMKEIGAWELKEPLPLGMTIAMAGVYWWHLPNGAYAHYSRGFDKDSMKTPDYVINAWKDGKDSIDVPMHRLIGMGSACVSDTLWAMRGRFVEGMRSLRLDGKSHKRQPIEVFRAAPHRSLVDLPVAINIEYETGAQQCSHPYPIQWIENDENDDYENDLEMQREVGDTENI